MVPAISPSRRIWRQMRRLAGVRQKVRIPTGQIKGAAVRAWRNSIEKEGAKYNCLKTFGGNQEVCLRAGGLPIPGPLFKEPSRRARRRGLGTMFL